MPETLRRFDDKLVPFELTQKTQGQTTGLERRVLQVEHIIYFPIGELNLGKANDLVPERKEKGKKTKQIRLCLVYFESNFIHKYTLSLYSFLIVVILQYFQKL